MVELFTESTQVYEIDVEVREVHIRRPRPFV